MSTKNGALVKVKKGAEGLACRICGATIHAGKVYRAFKNARGKFRYQCDGHAESTLRVRV